MPQAIISRHKLTAGEFFRDGNMLRLLGAKLRARGFRLDLPIAIARTEDQAVLTQDDPEPRVPRNHPQLVALLNRIKFGDAGAMPLLYGLLMAEGDDRAEIMADMEESMPESAEVYDDFGERGDGHSGKLTTTEAVASKRLCADVLLLFGVREEPM